MVKQTAIMATKLQGIVVKSNLDDIYPQNKVSALYSMTGHGSGKLAAFIF